MYGCYHTKILFHIYIPIYFLNGDENVPAFYRQNHKPVTQETCCQIKRMLKWMFEFLTKSENRENKIAHVNSIHITKSINLL